MKKYIEKEQEKINKMYKNKLKEVKIEYKPAICYAQDAFFDYIIHCQVELNKLKHKHNISDETKAVYKEYVQ